MRIGVVSDTHGHFDPRIAGLFSDCDHILHGGDIGSAKVLARLEQIAPVTAVVGNVDFLHLEGQLPEVARIRLGGCRFLVTHMLGSPLEPVAPIRHRLEEEPADVVIFGHSHRSYNSWVGGTLYFNPGSAGPRQQQEKRTAGVLTIEPQGTIVGRIYDLDE